MRNERRRRRATTTTKALELQLLSCCEDGRIEAMVIADGDGLPFAASGDSFACDEVAARMVLVGRKINEFSGTLLGAGHAWQVQMRKISIEGADLLVCAVGGTPESRTRQIKRGAEGALRILQAARTSATLPPWCAVTMTMDREIYRSHAVLLPRVQVPPRKASEHRVAGRRSHERSWRPKRDVRSP